METSILLPKNEKSGKVLIDFGGERLYGLAPYIRPRSGIRNQSGRGLLQEAARQKAETGEEDGRFFLRMEEEGRMPDAYQIHADRIAFPKWVITEVVHPLQYASRGDPFRFIRAIGWTHDGWVLGGGLLSEFYFQYAWPPEGRMARRFTNPDEAVHWLEED